MNQDCRLNPENKLGQVADEIKQKKSEYVKINRDIYFEEIGQLKCLNSGKIGKCLCSEDFEKLLGTMSRAKMKTLFDEFDQDDHKSIVLIDNCFYFLDREDYSYLKLTSTPFVLSVQTNMEVSNAGAS